MCNVDSENFEDTCLLISWVGSDPDLIYDIINIRDVVFDNKFTRDCLKVSSSVMVRCGRAKSLAMVRMISDNTDLLVKELNKLQSRNQKENIDPLNTSPKPKRPRYDDSRVLKELDHSSNNIDNEKDKIILSLTQENQKLKNELSEANRIIQSFCRDIKGLVHGVQKKIQERAVENSKDFFFNRENGNDAHSLACPVVELSDKVLIGTGKTEIPRQIFAQINWMRYNAATRKLLMAVFSREILSTHTLTGKPSPAFLTAEMPCKNRLDQQKVADIIEVVTFKCGVTDSQVRNAITTKCADENKMYKKRLEKLKNE